MANTTYLKTIVEPFLVDWAARKIGVPLHPQRVVVGQDSGGRPVNFEFDGVSPDGTTGVCVSASSSYKVGQMRKYFMEAAVLNRCRQFTRRIMVFTNRGNWEGFVNQCDGLLELSRIEPLICDEVPEEMRARILEVYTKAAREVGDRSGPGRRVPAKRG
jgi:hypothetical protein